MWSALCADAGEIVLAPHMQRVGHCPLRAGIVAHNEI